MKIMRADGKGAIRIAAVLAVMLSSAATAEVRSLETVGTLPLTPGSDSGVVPRDAAIEQALREAVIRIAQEFLADRPLEDPPLGESLEAEHQTNQSTLPGEEVPEPGAYAASDAEREAELARLERVLGRQMVPYTTRFRVIEDRGLRPVLFSDDPAVTEEYVVIVEVQVDVGRVRTRLIEAGMLDPRHVAAHANEVLLEVDGLLHYPAFVAFRDFLDEGLGAQMVVPVEMSSGRTVFDVAAEVSALEFLEALLASAPPQFRISPRHTSGGRIHVAVDWVPPPAPTESEGDR